MPKKTTMPEKTTCVICFEHCTSLEEWFVCDTCHEGMVCDACKKSPLFDYRCPICRKDFYHKEVMKKMYQFRLRTVLRWLYLATILLTASVSMLILLVAVPVLKYLMACFVTKATTATTSSTGSPSFTECELFSCHEPNLP